MKIELLRVAAFCAYLLSWLVLAVAAVAGAMPGFGRRRQVAVSITVPVLIGTLLQAGAALVITLTMRDGPLRPSAFELAGALGLSPLAAALFVWALRSAPGDSGAERLATSGAYAWLRHPIYLAFLAMLVATGLLASSGLKLAAAAALYLAGTELRIAFEEAGLAGQFPEEYAQYRLRTRWRYLPGLR
ncbi:MAG: isoprenylcysteine carboxylmethyltransferase family protein [Acidobacteriia bacterium]|nr:isoprenylcysteine carboxylmethyltransferase family protein [Terriglobia bacterium]